MKQAPLIENYPNLTALEILQKIGTKEIAGLWLRDFHYEKAEKSKDIKEEEAMKILKEFDIDRQADYNHWNMFN